MQLQDPSAIHQTEGHRVEMLLVRKGFPLPHYQTDVVLGHVSRFEPQEGFGKVTGYVVRDLDGDLRIASTFAKGRILFSVSDIACDAIEFALRNGHGVYVLDRQVMTKIDDVSAFDFAELCSFDGVLELYEPAHLDLAA